MNEESEKHLAYFLAVIRTKGTLEDVDFRRFLLQSTRVHLTAHQSRLPTSTY